jgi:hypothetical protein
LSFELPPEAKMGKKKRDVSSLVTSAVARPPLFKKLDELGKGHEHCLLTANNLGGR